MLKKKLYSFFIGAVWSVSMITVALAAAPAAPAGEGRVIPYPAGYDTMREGASAYNGLGNSGNSPYYSALDIYRLTSTDRLTILPRYKTYQQTTEITCGPAAALTVLHHYGNTDWDERGIAAIMETKPEIGTDTAGMVKFFKQIGWNVESSLTAASDSGMTFATMQEFKDFVITNLKNNTPILVENIDWGGHWRVIIGYDTMGTEPVADDVLILADSYDTADHLQDGYAVNPAEKFYYMWFDAHMLPKGQRQQQWLTARPVQAGTGPAEQQ
ncbi:MAG: C39 family peptidase [Sporomusaceae bacterium]|nr:C39 family peptidase [Sporomusaceae bacterium]